MNKNSIIEMIHQQIVDTINNYRDLRIKIEDINVSIRGETIYFQCKRFEHSEKIEALQTAYVVDTKVDAKTAIELNTAVILDRIIFSNNI